jgi:hypothetical protein
MLSQIGAGAEEQRVLAKLYEMARMIPPGCLPWGSRLMMRAQPACSGLTLPRCGRRAMNDIAPTASLRTLLATCRLPGLGTGGNVACDYAYQEEQQFAVMGRNGEITVRSPVRAEWSGGRGCREGPNALNMSVAAGGDLVCGDTTDFAVVLAPPPSETPDF